MKKLLLFVFSVLAVLLSSCEKERNTVFFENDRFQICGIDAELSDLTATGGFLCINNTSDSFWLMDNAYTIEKRVLGKWKPLLANSNASWFDLAYSIAPADYWKELLDWEYAYGRLEPGRYRLLRKIRQNDQQQMLVVNFKISSNEQVDPTIRRSLHSEVHT